MQRLQVFLYNFFQQLLQQGGGIMVPTITAVDQDRNTEEGGADDEEHMSTAVSWCVVCGDFVLFSSRDTCGAEDDETTFP